MMVIAHDPLYLGTNIPDRKYPDPRNLEHERSSTSGNCKIHTQVTPCADGAGEIEAASPDSIWQDKQGTLRQYV
jgi:hypothetical protein